MTPLGMRPPRLYKLERLGEPLLPLERFWQRLARGVLFGGALILGSLAIGVIGYHLLAGLGWVDSILNASMILAGMGPVDVLHSTAAKLFASGYAIFSGVMFLTSVGVVLTPVAHRVLHRFHVADEDRQ